MNSFPSICAVALIFAAALSPVSLVAQEAPPIEVRGEDGLDRLLQSIFTGPNAAMRPQVRSALLQTDQAKKLTALETVLADLRKPSGAYAFVAGERARTLAGVGRDDEARAEFEHLIETYPQTLPLRMLAIDALSFGSEAVAAARLWMELAATEPQAARLLDGYTLDAVSGNLEAIGRLDTQAALFLALERIGYDPGSAARASGMNYAIFTNAAEDPEREDVARAALAKVADPSALQSIRADAQYSAFWPAIDMSPETLTERVADYVGQIGRDAATTRDGATGGVFLRQAVAYGDPQAVLARYGNELERAFAASADAGNAPLGFAFWVSPIAKAHLVNGQANKADALYRQAIRAFSGMDSTIKLNASANYAQFLLESGRLQEALETIEPAIAELDEREMALNARAQMLAVKVRALHLLGRLSDEEPALKAFETLARDLPALYAQTMMQIGRFDAAQRAIATNLRGSNYRLALGYLQPSFAAHLSPSERRDEGLKGQLRYDPVIVRLLKEKGRIETYEPVRIELEQWPDITPPSEVFAEPVNAAE
ncbi:hypothetical protein [Erythrobacter litoralis]|uniref:Tetratricopeptide repeat protein n=1 Tax=Erythrobacter litoralis (strain HTCC2594) TaxID=314225 RepID=Q2N9I9_ERYLH|nr:hypothetical protein [Erythrobacter litoralis]ABC63652.1 hypothetical protein ELI_07800 [Erythrobacter litoralis HTCC2594]